jgi:hypothetical protein
MLPRKSTSVDESPKIPGTSTIDAAAPANTVSESHGVLNLRCSRRKRSGSWR